MGKKIISSGQKHFLEYFAGQPELVNNFYFTGGTALNLHYLHYRFSEDLDFFSSEEIDPTEITPFIKKSQSQLEFEKFDYEQSFNRNIYQLIFGPEEFLKVEFTNFPFPNIEKPARVNGIFVDSLIDIAVNKVFTIYQKPRGRDFFDLYMILKKKKWDIFDLLVKAQTKFDWHIDWVQFGSQLNKVSQLKDDPILVDGEFDLAKVEKYFLKLSKEVGQKSLKN
jgi:predicted nucleotidyltransferase component of viral defense system